jgi:hypothetical protein
MTTTSKKIRTFTVAAAAALAGLATFSMPASSAAQEGRNIGRAEKMEGEARGLAEQRHKWDKAAWLYRSAAALRPAGDVEAVEDLQMAARLAWYVGDHAQAIEDLETASQRATEGGDAFTAANLLVDAAWVAQRTGRHDQARKLADLAHVRAESPVLSDDVRSLVTDRVIDLTATVQVASLGDAPQD